VLCFRNTSLDGRKILSYTFVCSLKICAVYYVDPEWCSGSTGDFESLSISSILISGAKILWKRGRVRFIAPVLKTDDPKGSVSSNLTTSTRLSRGTSVVDYRAHNPKDGGSSPSPATRHAAVA
jgi:hypothetical protein